jgi:hypothetical protein
VAEPEAARTAIERALAGADLEIDAWKRIQPSLEDVFIRLVQAAGGAVAG